MNTITKDLYGIAWQDWQDGYNELSQEFGPHLRRASKTVTRMLAKVPFVPMSCLVFLGDLYFFFSHGMELMPHEAASMILASGVAAIFSATALLDKPRLFHVLQAVASFIGNISFMLTLAP